MADVKISGLPSDTSLDGNHYVPLNDPTGPTTKRTLLSTLAAWFFSQANIPAGSGSPITRDDDMLFDFVLSGLVWTGDAYASTRNASMTSGFVYINGLKITIAAVTARSFTASKDTYIDVLSNGDGTGTLVYTEVANNAASPALAANSLRIGIIVTGASNIAAVGSINQGQIGKVLPIASSIPYMLTDSLGNLICNRSSNPTLIGYREITSNFATATTGSDVDVTGLSAPVLIPTGGRNVRVSSKASGMATNSASATVLRYKVKEGATQLNEGASVQRTANDSWPADAVGYASPTAGLHTYKTAINTTTATTTVNNDPTYPAFIAVELE